MNVFGKSERSWRKARKRGVSPIIATILLVAITVVLAAVLYVLITGLTHGPGSVGIGTAFNAGNPVSSTCGAGNTYAANGCKAGDIIYTLTVESSSITFTSAQFEVKTATGSIAAITTGTGGFAIVNTAGVAVAASAATSASLAMTSPFSVFSAVAGACNGNTCSSSSPLTSIYTIVIDLGTAPSPSGQGYTFVAIGVGSYSGTTSPVSLP
ncbi:MAG TPA: archaellin/type IV pilin N-terminal domain-containing protein [Thermoplasmata archaeon]|nr:archaellin/type IV pilin N-terminal domain-containing protein [Thermoplasmata archaeon]